MSETEYGRTLREVGRDVGSDGVAAMDRTASTLGDLGAKAGGAASEAVSNAGAAVRDATRKAGNAASDLGNDVYHRGQRVGREVANHIESQPLSSVIVAAVAGLCVGMLLARR